VLVTAPLVRWAAPTVAAHLPAGAPLALRDYSVLGTVRHHWWVTATSAVLGAASHLGWDAFTHAGVDGGRIAVPALHAGAPTTKLAEAARRHDRAYRESLRARFGVTADPA